MVVVESILNLYGDNSDKIQLSVLLRKYTQLILIIIYKASSGTTPN